jgi:WD40 repeat protein
MKKLNLLLLVLFAFFGLEQFITAQKPEFFVAKKSYEGVHLNAFSSNNMLYALVEGDYGETPRLSIYKTANSRLIKTFNLGKMNYEDIVFCNKSDCLFVTSYWGRIIKLDLKNGEVLSNNQLKGAKGKSRIDKLTRYVARASNDTLSIRDINTHELVFTMVSQSRINEFAFSNDGKYILIGGSMGDIALWDLKTGKRTLVFKTESKKGIRTLALSNDGSYAVSSNEDGTHIKLWNTQTGEKIKAFEGSEKPWALAISPDNKYILSKEYKELILRNRVTGKIENSKKIEWTASPVFSQNGNYVLDGRNFLNLTSLKPVNETKTCSVIGTSKNYMSNDKDFYISGGYSYGMSILFGLEGYSKNRIFRNRILDYKDQYYLARDGYWDSGTVRLFETKTNKPVRVVNEDGELFPLQSSLNKDGSLYVKAINEKNIAIIDSKTGQTKKEIVAHNDEISYLSYSKDGKYIFSLSKEGLLKLHHATNYNLIRSIDLSKYGINEIVLSPTNDYFMAKSWSMQQFVHDEFFVFNILSGEMEHRFYAYDASFSNDGKVILVLSTKSIKQISTDSGQEIQTINRHYTDRYKISFVNGNKFFYVTDNEGSCSFYETKTAKLAATLDIVGISTSNEKMDYGYVVHSPDGKFDGTQNAIEHVYFVKGYDIIEVSSLYEQFYTPNLLAQILGNQTIIGPEINIENLKPAPLVKIISPSNSGDLRGFQPKGPKNLKSLKEAINVTVKASDQGGGINEIRLYHNGKLVNTSQRGYNVVEAKGSEQVKTFTISLINGENRIKATAFSNQRTESLADEIIVFYEGVKSPADLYMLVIGIDKYKNPKYNLNYAIADANAFKKQVELGSNTIFKKKGGCIPS